ncbi:hypothetical protein AB0K02_29260 [Streptomyces sp. NPDC049597]
MSDAYAAAGPQPTTMPAPLIPLPPTAAALGDAGGVGGTAQALVQNGEAQ